MPPDNATVEAFPISTGAFGLRSDWFQNFVPRLVPSAYLLMVLLLVISVGIMALRRFERADLEKKLWHFPIILTVVLFWPALVLGLKDLIDTFDTFLVHDVFGIAWKGFGFPEIGGITGFIGWSAEGLARLLPNLAYWIIYAFYLISFFFYAALGPLVLAKGILFDEVDAFLELVKEITLLLLWQTTLVILVAFVLPDIVSGKPFPPRPPANFYFLSLILGVMIFFIPSLARKFGGHLGSAFIPLGFKWGGAVIGISAFGRLAGAALSTSGVATVGGPEWEIWKDRLSNAEEFKRRYENKKRVQDLEAEDRVLERHFREEQEKGDHAVKSPDKEPGLIDLSKKAKSELAPDPKDESP